MVCDLELLKPNFNLRLSDEIKMLLVNFKSIVHEYVKLHNDYCKMKISEEKAKVKRGKINDEKLDQRYEQISFEQEMTRICKELVQKLPENVQPILQKNHLNMHLGLRVDKASKPKLGSVWNIIACFPTSVQAATNKGKSVS